jgi:glutaminyl-peptide cyclotransferase
MFGFIPWILVQPPSFDGELAFSILQNLVEQGNRYYSSPHRKEGIEEMKSHFICPEWTVQKFEVLEHISGQYYTLENQICRIQPQNKNRIILGTHFDTRMWAEESAVSSLQNTPIVGANDGTSGVAVLAALSHLLAIYTLDVGIDIVLFDGEEFGRPKTGGYCQGSRYMATHIDELYPNKEYPKNVVVLDMVGDKDLQIQWEKTSQRRYPDLHKELWMIGSNIDATIFIDGTYGSIIDDHSPFSDLGIPSALVIDFDYSYWHTHQDTLDKCSKKSLQIVGDVIWKWLNTQSSSN